MDTVDNFEIPLEIYPFSCVGIIGTYRIRSPRKVKSILKEMGFKLICLLEIGHPGLLGVLVGGEKTRFSANGLEDFWRTNFGPAVIQLFKSGQPVNKLLTKCGYVVNSHQITELHPKHGISSKNFRQGGGHVPRRREESVTSDCTASAADRGGGGGRGGVLSGGRGVCAPWTPTARQESAVSQ